MGKPADEIIAETLDWVHDRILYAAADNLTDNLDSFPLFGFGLAFVKRSAEDAIMNRVENRIIPQSEEHLQLQLEFMRELAAANDEAGIVDRYEAELLDSDFIWAMADGPKDAKERLREDLVEKNVGLVRKAASWVEAADGEMFEDYIALADFLDKDNGEVLDDLREMFFFVDILKAHREHLDPGKLSSVLDHPRVAEWFFDHLIDGLEDGQEQVIAEMQEELETRRDLS